MSQLPDATSPAPTPDPLGSPLARSVFEASTECIIVLDPMGIVIAVNRAFCALYRINAKSAVGAHYMGFSQDFEIRRFGDSLEHERWVTARALRGETVRGVSQGVRNRATGRELFGRYGASPVFEEGRFVATIITILDVTESTRASQALDAALSAAEVGTWRADMVEGKLWADANFARLCGLSKEEVDGGSLERLYDLIHPDDRPWVLRRFREAAEALAPHEETFRIVLADETERWLVSRGKTAFSQSGEPTERVGSIVDVTRQRESEAALRENEERTRLALEASGMGTWEFDARTMIAHTSPEVGPLYGEPSGFAYANTAAWLDAVHPDDRDRLVEARQKLFERGTPYDQEYRVPQKDGGLRWLQSKASLFRDSEGRPWKAIGVVSDITARREADKLLASATDAVPAFIAFLDADLIYRFCNRRFEEWFGRPRSQIVGRSIREIVGEATFAQLRPYLEKALGGEPAAYAQWLGFPQGRRFMRASYIPSFDATGRVDGLSAMIDDETEQRLTEERLRASEERFRRVVEAATVGVVVNDVTGRFLYANPPLLAMLGYSTEDLQAGHLSWDGIQVPELRVRDDLALDQLRETGACDPYETELIARDGSRVPVYIGAAFVPDESGEGVHGAAFITDLTPLKAAEEELQALNRELDAKVRARTAELERANRDLSEFSYSVAHDLRAPLRAIVSTSRILLEDAGERLTEDERSLLQRQSTNGIRLARIVDDLLNFGRLAKADLRKRRFDLSAQARAVAEEVRGRWASGCEIEVQEGLSAVGDPSLVGYVLTNLLDNACKFSPDGGTVSVGEEGGAFYVRDQGVGFDMEHAHKIFVAFERLVDQETFPGTGVGLANVKRIVERHDGRVWAESEPGKGSTFWFTL